MKLKSLGFLYCILFDTGSRLYICYTFLKLYVILDYFWVIINTLFFQVPGPQKNHRKKFTRIFLNLFLAPALELTSSSGCVRLRMKVCVHIHHAWRSDLCSTAGPPTNCISLFAMPPPPMPPLPRAAASSAPISSSSQLYFASLPHCAELSAHSSALQLLLSLPLSST